jgi:hypothetical protein
MRMFIKTLIFVFIAFSLAACEKANNPESPASIEKPTQDYSGTFEVTFTNYKNTSSTVTLTGNINISFSTNTYSYDGTILNSDNELSGSLHDTGTYTLRGNNIEMYDNATRLMNPIWQPSLYLSGTYTYSQSNNQVTIQGEGQYGTIKLILNI